MRNNNYYNALLHKDLSQYYFFMKSISKSKKQSFKKFPVLKEKRSTRMEYKKNQLRRFVYSNIRPKRDKRRL